MTKYRVLTAILSCMLLLIASVLCVGAETYPSYLVSVTDASELLTDGQEAEINAALAKASDKMGIPVCAYAFEYAGREFWGEDFLAAHGLDRDDDLVLMVVTVTRSEVYYDLYTYGNACTRINEKEFNYILDDDSVYHNLKRGNLTQGLCAYAELSAQAYTGRLGISWLLILLVALAVGCVAGVLSVKSVVSSYKKKNPSTSYPLDRFAKLDLTHREDRVISKFVTHTFISTGSRGGRGGGSRMGGGGGHRGGR